MPTNRKPPNRKNTSPTARPSVKDGRSRKHVPDPRGQRHRTQGADREGTAERPRATADGARRQPGTARDARRQPGGGRAQSDRSQHHRPHVAQRDPQRQADRLNKPRPSLAQAEEDRFQSVTLDVEGRKVTLTRRHFLYGAIGAGAAAIMAAGAVMSDEREEKGNAGIEVAQDAVAQLDDFQEAPLESLLEPIASYDLPYGSLVWSSCDELACCLTPTETASPLAQVSAMLLSTGEMHTLLEGPVGASEGFEIVDARASMRGAVWVEAATAEERWRVLCAPMTETVSLGEARILDEGDASLQIPSIAASEGCAWWQVSPPASDANASEKQSVLKRARFAGGNGTDILSFQGREACPVCACGDGVAVAARNPEFNGAFDLLKIGNDSTEPQDSLTLPSGMVPCALGWGPNGFSFCFEGIYDYGGGISNLGTYTPAGAHKPGAGYDGLRWFRFGRTPTSSPFWCGGNRYLVKSTMSVCAVDIEKGAFCPLDVESGCAGWGDQLCSTGSGGVAVTAMQLNGDGGKLTRVRVWSAL